MDYITIDDLEVFANHGVLKEENNLGQKFLISAKLYYDFRDASREDEIEYAVNYAQVCANIVEYMKSNTFKLIETVADRLAIMLLVNYSNLYRVEVTVKKPWAPIGFPINNVMATVERKWTEVYLSIGSNMGNKEENLDYVVECLKDNEYFKNVKASAFIETEPYGGVEQDSFLNGAIKLQTIMSPHQLLAYIHVLEQDKGREREIHWGPRTLDVDILFYEDKVISDDDLIIPHPDMVNRSFVLDPMAELAPHFIHPVTKKSILQMKNTLDSQNINK